MIEVSLQFPFMLKKKLKFIDKKAKSGKKHS
jgi:hypothetical protein